MRGMGLRDFMWMAVCWLLLPLHFLSSSEKLLCGCGCREDMVCSSCQPHVGSALVLHTARTVCPPELGGALPGFCKECA